MAESCIGHVAYGEGGNGASFSGYRTFAMQIGISSQLGRSLGKLLWPFPAPQNRRVAMTGLTSIAIVWARRLAKTREFWDPPPGDHTDAIYRRGDPRRMARSRM